jgi:glycosyltransferase involved in cell wall biosynthesis
LLILKTRAVLAAHSFDILHAHHYEGLIAALMARGGRDIPVVYDAHTLLSGELPYYGNAWTGPLKGWVGGLVDHSLPSKADGIVTVSDDITRRLQPTMRSPDRIITIPNGVELDLFSVDRDRLRCSVSNPRTVIYAGTLAGFQGTDLLLRCFAQVAAKHADVRLRIVSSSSFAPYEELASQLTIRDRIDLFQTDLAALPHLIAQADVAVNPRPLCDGIPQKNLNYMAAGAPIVCFAGAAEQLSAETALIVANGDLDAYAAAICWALEHPGEAAEMGRRGRAYVVTHCNWEEAARRTEDFHRALIEAKRLVAAA